eukprot:485496-Pelagomonas_calceolata.AAC.3
MVAAQKFPIHRLPVTFLRGLCTLLQTITKASLHHFKAYTGLNPMVRDSEGLKRMLALLLTSEHSCRACGAAKAASSWESFTSRLITRAGRMAQRGREWRSSSTWVRNKGTQAGQYRHTDGGQCIRMQFIRTGRQQKTK